MLSNTLSFLSSFNVSDQVSHPFKTTGKIIVLYILINVSNKETNFGLNGKNKIALNSQTTKLEKSFRARLRE